MFANAGYGGVVIGTTAPLKINVSANSGRRRSKTGTIFLSRVKPVMVEVEAEFQLANFGVDILAGEFQTVTPDGYLTLENLDAITGLVIHPSGGNNIPLNKEYYDRLAVGTVYTAPVPIEE